MREEPAVRECEVTSLTACEILGQYRKNTLDVDDVVSACVNRIDARDRIIRAWEYVDRQAAYEFRKQEHSRNQGLALYGVPIGVKDIIETADMPTGYGSTSYKGHRPARDATCVALARRAGAIVLGKTVSTEFASAVPSETRNPWNLRHTPGGSSSGSAAAVADGMVPVSLGTQTAGSVIRPASFCGVVGFKPSFGMIGRSGIALVAESLDTVGVFARTVRDAALVASAVSQRPSLARFNPLTTSARIGICRTTQWVKATRDTTRVVEETAERLSGAGAAVEEKTLPASFELLYDAQRTIMGYEAARALSYERLAAGASLSADLTAFVEESSRFTVAEYDRALRDAESVRATSANIFGACDVLLTPSAPGAAPGGLKSTGDASFNGVWTALHAPCLNLPVGLSRGGLPVGVQFVAPKGADGDLVRIAAWAERILEDSTKNDRYPRLPATE